MIPITTVRGPWSNKVKSLLETSGFHDVWLYAESVYTKLFLSRLRDIYVGEWVQGVNLSTTLTIYRELKQSITISPYLSIMRSRKLRNAIDKMRLSSHNSYIETGRHRNIVGKTEHVSFAALTIWRTNIISH